MRNNNHFLNKPKFKTYKIGKIKIKLFLDKKVFSPSKAGPKFAGYLKVKKGEKVIDIGTGSGLIAITAAKMGAKVFATDVNSESIKMAKYNSEINNVKINLSLGKYFADFKEEFDIIIANLPQEILPLSYQRTIGKDLTNNIHGGSNGSNVLLHFLNIAPKYMNKGSKIFMAVYSGADYKKLFSNVASNFDAKLIGFEILEVKNFIPQNIKFYLDLKNKGKIDIFKKNNKWYSYACFFELKLK